MSAFRFIGLLNRPVFREILLAITAAPLTRNTAISALWRTKENRYYPTLMGSVKTNIQTNKKMNPLQNGAGTAMLERLPCTSYASNLWNVEKKKKKKAK